MTKITYAYLPFKQIFPLSSRLGSKPFEAYVLAWELAWGVSKFVSGNLDEVRQGPNDYCIYKIDSKLFTELTQRASQNVQANLDLHQRVVHWAKEGKASLQERRETKIPWAKKDWLWKYGKPEIRTNSHGQGQVLVIHDDSIVIPVYGEIIKSRNPKSLMKSQEAHGMLEFLKKYHILARLSEATIRKSDLKMLGCSSAKSKLGKRVLEAVKQA